MKKTLIVFVLIVLIMLMVFPAAANNQTIQTDDIVKFGHYEQDNNLNNGKEELYWEVVTVDGDRALLLSYYGLDTRAYGKAMDVSEYTNENLNWATCDLRNWLTGQFILEAFSEEERANLLSVENVTNHNDFTITTTDIVFCFSSEEVHDNEDFTTWYYRHEEKDAYCFSTSKSPTPYAASKFKKDAGAIDEDGNCYWWLRDLSESVTYNEACITGIASDEQCPVFCDYLVTVCPAVWVNVNALQKIPYRLWLNQGTETMDESDFDSYEDYEEYVEYFVTETESIQQRLKNLGYYHSYVNGEYNNATVNAVKKFQEASGIYADGSADPVTQDILFSNRAVRATPTPAPTETPKPVVTPKPAPKLSITKKTLVVGSSFAVKVKNLGKQKVAWKSSNPQIASVSGKGIVKAIKPGDTVITAAIGKTKLKLSVSVKARPSLSVTDKTLTAGQSLTIRVNNRNGASVKWSSSNKRVATVSGSGVVKAKKAGKAVITAKIYGIKLKATITVKSKPKAKKAKSKSKSNYMSDRELIEMAKGYFVLCGGTYEYITGASISHSGNYSYVYLAYNFHCYVVKVYRPTGLGLGIKKLF